MNSILRRRRALMGAKGESFPVQEIGVELIETILTGYVVDADTGALTGNSGGRYCTYIPVNPNYRYQFRKYTNRQGFGAWYDKEKNYISGFSASNNSTYDNKTPPTMARYMRWSGYYASSGGPLSIKRIS